MISAHLVFLVRFSYLPSEKVLVSTQVHRLFLPSESFIFPPFGACVFLLSRRRFACQFSFRVSIRFYFSRRRMRQFSFRVSVRFYFSRRRMRQFRFSVRFYFSRRRMRFSYTRVTSRRRCFIVSYFPLQDAEEPSVFLAEMLPCTRWPRVRCCSGYVILSKDLQYFFFLIELLSVSNFFCCWYSQVSVSTKSPTIRSRFCVSASVSFGDVSPSVF